MQIQTHYTTLGLAPTAPTLVIRAAYKALVLLNHPDKTIHLPASERAYHSAVFCSIQEAFDVLGNASLKASYDAELAHHDGTVNIQSSTFHHEFHAKRHPTHTKGSSSIHLTTAEEKTAMKAKTEAALIELRSKRRTRDSEEAILSLVDLKFMLKTWRDLAHENRNDAIMFAHCTIMIHEYDAKVAQRESEHDDWVNNMATPKHAPHAPKTRKSTPEPQQNDRFASAPGAPHKKTHNHLHSPLFPSFPTSPTSSTTSTPALASRAEGRFPQLRQARAQHTTDFSSNRPNSYGCQEYKKRTQPAKATAVRAEKQAQKQRAEDFTRKEAERVAKVRAKVSAPSKGNVRVRMNSVYNGERKGEKDIKEAGGLFRRKTCSKCGNEHVSVAEWKKCMQVN